MDLARSDLGTVMTRPGGRLGISMSANGQTTDLGQLICGNEFQIGVFLSGPANPAAPCRRISTTLRRSSGRTHTLTHPVPGAGAYNSHSLPTYAVFPWRLRISPVASWARSLRYRFLVSIPGFDRAIALLAHTPDLPQPSASPPRVPAEPQ